MTRLQAVPGVKLLYQLKQDCQIVDTPLRYFIIGQLVLVALVVAIRGPRAIALPLLLLQASMIAFLIKTSPELYAMFGALRAPILVLCWFGAYFVWYCAYAIFQFERPPWWAIVALPLTTVVLCAYDIMDSGVPIIARALSLTASLIAVLHALFAVIRGGLDDLSEPRRRFRMCFVGCVTGLTAVILVLEIVFVGREPDWLPVLFTAIIASGVLLVGVPLLVRPDDLLPEPEPKATAESLELNLADQRLHDNLISAMDNRAYARTGLTIRHLADELSLPEHQLRKLINTRLGYKNFSTFLNGYRIAEARRRLADPAEARIPILTIALDAGFASIAPFNRAFRQMEGMTPSEYRKNELQPSNVVTELRRKP